jgi:competence ComEA-like helix-hairpin-helix protein
MKVTRWIGMAVLVAWGLGVPVTEAVLAGQPGRAEVDVDKSGAAAKDKKPVREVTVKAEGKVNINTASKTELMTLDGVGAGIAQKIIDHRTARGPFKKVDDLATVAGVGKRVVEKNPGRLTVK